MQNGRQRCQRQEKLSALLQMGRILLLLLLLWSVGMNGAIAAKLDPYVSRYLRASEPIELPANTQGQTRSFSGIELSAGKQLFDSSCKTCHVGGATLPDPTVPLSLAALQGATPPRNNLDNLVAFMRNPMSYDGSEEGLSCRKVSPSWMSDQELQNLAAFILRAAEVAPGWGTSEF